MNKEQFLAFLDEDVTDEQVAVFNDFLLPRLKERPISDETLEYIALILDERHPNGVCYYHNFNTPWREENDERPLWLIIAYQAGAFIAKDGTRIDDQGGYPSDIWVSENRNDSIYIAGVGYKGQPELTIQGIDDAIEEMVSDPDLFWDY